MSTPERSPIRILRTSTKKQSGKRRNTSSTTKELRENNRKFRLDKCLAFLALVFDECERPETEEQFADALPNGQLLCIVAQYVCRRCNLSCFDFPKLARTTSTPNQSREKSQNHAKFVSFCNEINIPSNNVPSLQDIVEKRVHVVVDVLLCVQKFAQQHSSPVKVVTMNMDEYLTPSKLARDVAREATKSSGLLRVLRPSFGGDESPPSVKIGTPSYVFTAVEPDQSHMSPVSMERGGDILVDASMLSKLDSITQKVQEERSSQDGNDLTPTPNMQNPSMVRDMARKSSTRKRLLDQKDQNISTLTSKVNNYMNENKRLEEELKKEVRKTRGLQQSHDKTRDEINLQARAFEENASVTCALKQEVLELRKQLATTNKENESQSRQISRLSSLNKDLEASKMDLEAAGAEEAKQSTLAHIQETSQLTHEIQRLEEELTSSTTAAEQKDTIIEALRMEVQEAKVQAEEMSKAMASMMEETEELRSIELERKTRHEELVSLLEETEIKLDEAQEETRQTSKKCEARLAVHENQAQWFRQATSTLQVKVRAVGAAGKKVSEEVRSQMDSMSTDFGEIAKAVVASITQLTTIKDDSVKQYRREQRSRQKVFNELQRLRGNIRVLCRTRPSKNLASKEIETGAYGTTTFNSEEDITVRNAAKKKRSANAR